MLNIQQLLWNFPIIIEWQKVLRGTLVTRKESELKTSEKQKKMKISLSKKLHSLEKPIKRPLKLVKRFFQTENFEETRGGTLRWKFSKKSQSAEKIKGKSEKNCLSWIALIYSLWKFIKVGEEKSCHCKSRAFFQKLRLKTQNLAYVHALELRWTQSSNNSLDDSTTLDFSVELFLNILQFAFLNKMKFTTHSFRILSVYGHNFHSF